MAWGLEHIDSKELTEWSSFWTLKNEEAEQRGDESSPEPGELERLEAEALDEMDEGDE